MQSPSRPKQLPLPVQFLLGVILVIALSIWTFSQLMKPPMNEVFLMAQFLSITAIISVLAGYLVYRLGWISHAPSIRWAILGGYILASGLTFLNVWMTARLMFASQHDLQLATVLLIFAGGIAAALGYFLASAITDRLGGLNRAVGKIAQGDFKARLPVNGQDEIARLAASFNSMASQLELANARQHEVETMRRDLIAWVSHDLQTPLTSIRAMVEALADGVVDDPQTTQRYLRNSQREIEALSSLIDDLFQMAQIDAGGLTLTREAGSLCDLISDTLESFSELARQRQIELRGNVTPEIDPVEVDFRLVSRALNNLLSNALRYTSAGGSVQVRAVTALSGVQVSVCDTGEGIPQDDLPYIFERFYRGEKSRNRATGGAGLGLAIARGIIEAHGGQLMVESNPGSTCFSFTLPKARSS